MSYTLYIITAHRSPSTGTRRPRSAHAHVPGKKTGPGLADYSRHLKTPPRSLVICEFKSFFFPRASLISTTDPGSPRLAHFG